VGAFSGVENAKTWGPSPEMPKTGSPLAKGELTAPVAPTASAQLQLQLRRQGGENGRTKHETDQTKTAVVSMPASLPMRTALRKPTSR
jgi:hypothetical protein